MEYKSSPIGFSIHSIHENAIFGEASLHVTVEDESSGPYLKLEQISDEKEAGVVKLEIEQLEQVLVSARKLIKAHSES